MSVCLKDLAPDAHIIVVVVYPECAPARMAAARYCDECIASGRAVGELQRLAAPGRWHGTAPVGAVRPMKLVPRLEEAKRQIILEAIAANNGKIYPAARALGIAPATIYRTLKVVDDDSTDRAQRLSPGSAR